MLQMTLLSQAYHIFSNSCFFGLIGEVVFDDESAFVEDRVSELVRDTTKRMTESVTRQSSGRC